MFGDEYMLAPQLAQGGRNRSVYLPVLPAPQLWVSFFNASARFKGGQRISVPTPLDSFPLFVRRNATPYPPPPPPPPRIVCDGSCSEAADTDAVVGGSFLHAAAPDFAACCSMCKAHSECSVFAFGPYSAGEPASPANPNTCFLLGPRNQTRHRRGRSLGCVR